MSETSEAIYPGFHVRRRRREDRVRVKKALMGFGVSEDCDLDALCHSMASVRTKYKLPPSKIGRKALKKLPKVNESWFVTSDSPIATNRARTFVRQAARGTLVLRSKNGTMQSCASIADLSSAEPGFWCHTTDPRVWSGENSKAEAPSGWYTCSIQPKETKVTDTCSIYEVGQLQKYTPEVRPDCARVWFKSDLSESPIWSDSSSPKLRFRGLMDVMGDGTDDASEESDEAEESTTDIGQSA